MSWLKSRGPRGVRMVIGDKAVSMVNSIAEVFPGAKYQRRTVRFYRNALAKTPKRPRGPAMFMTIYAMESHEAAKVKAESVASELETTRFKEAARWFARILSRR